ncbi:MAG: class III poly(R)-hydroxyalkanoic acid synthase subunit PhaC [Deltaproteobacteria bacterium HGW-Deltaproteobacteria-12]|jgi:polyhydroxyalkanoate synthase|nr:MAG: class III poly(R)-hydroxyalkanoic acid synthase subunit PhaC [Deltaproteobacteria bacterium HGW-Deltaproteobacteria-12]
MTQTKIPVDLILESLAQSAEETQKRITRASDVLLSPLNTDLAGTPHEIVYEEDRVKLKHYSRDASDENKLKTPLLVVYALINRETMLDLQPDRSVVQSFLSDGIDLYMVDWGYPTRKDRFLTIDDHVNGYLNNAVDFIREKYGIPKINLMGICMGGSFCTMYSALHPEKIKNLITTVTPTNFDTDKGLLHIWMKNLNVDKMIRSFGNIPGDLMNFAFLLLNPARLMIDKYVGFAENMDKKDFVENFIRMERWIFDSPDVPGETFRQFIEDCYQNNLLIQSKMHLNGKRVDLKKLTMPLLNFYGKFDHLVPPEACEQLTSMVGSKDVEDVCLETGHIGIYVSSKFQKQFAPKIAQWLKKRDQEDAPLQKAPTGNKRKIDNQGKIAKSPVPKTAVKRSQPAPKTADPADKRAVSKGKSLLMQKIAEAI